MAQFKQKSGNSGIRGGVFFVVSVMASKALGATAVQSQAEEADLGPHSSLITHHQLHTVDNAYFFLLLLTRR